MRSTVVIALSLVCAALVLSGPADAQKTKLVGVTGTVDIGNFPLDAEGNIKVSGAVGPIASSTFFELPGPIDLPPGAVVRTAPFPAGDWTTMVVYVHSVDSFSGHGGGFTIEFGDDEVFGFVPGGAASGYIPPTGTTTLMPVAVMGPEARIYLYNGASSIPLRTVRVMVYLSR